MDTTPKHEDDQNLVEQKSGLVTVMRTLTNVATCVAILWLISNSATIQASEQKTAYPHVIECEVKGVWHFAYLDRIETDGRAYYISPSGKAAATVEGGVVTRAGAKAGNCSGKTLKELVASGQAHFIRN